MAEKYVVKKGKYFWPTKAMKKIANINDPQIYEKASKDPIKFWEGLAKEGIVWEKKWKKAYVEKLPYFWWFKGAELNFCVNALDRNLKHPTQPALIWVPEPINEPKVVWTYGELYDRVNKFANVLKKYGIRKGDVVSIYLPMIPEAVVAMLACTRIGAVHSVVFSAFSSNALKTRIEDGKAKLLITADGYYRRGKKEILLEKAVKAARGTTVKKIIVVNRLKTKIKGKKILDYNKEMASAHSYCNPEIVKSEDPLFILYTSGTTGTPKGIVHDTGGYAVQSYWTTKWNFNLNPGDVMWCTADIGWITGHTYAVYGPLLVGATTLLYEGAPDYPTFGRWWQIIAENKVNVFYTAPTAIRMFRRAGEKWLRGHNLSSLKILGSVGEPIDKESWMWYFQKIGQGRCPIIDTWWQTETGGTLINVLPGIGPFVPSVAGKSFPGVFHEVVDKNGKKVQEGEQGFLVQKSPFAPGMLHGVFNNHKRYVKTYWSKFKNKYDTSDGAIIQDGLIKITGRTDDVMKVAGHRLSTAELEDALHQNELVGDCAVVSMADKIKGEVPVAFVVLKKGNASSKVEEALKKHVKKQIGPTAIPKKIFFVKELPMTRSGKIMRRILRNLLSRETPKGLMTLVNPESVEQIAQVIREQI